MHETFDFAYDVRNREHVTGRVNMTIANGPNVMTSKATVTSRWIGASCGDTH